tara:strand:- start:21 stop:395 length:375 start_codon:yes stop_codon:yes gene_type:complete
MTKLALIHNERICEILPDGSATFPVHEDLVWVTVPDNTTTADTYVDSAVVKRPAATTSEIWAEVRRQRDRKLADCDWRASSDLTLTDAWKNYRQSLRNIPETSPNPTLDSNGVLGNVTWPDIPS